MKQRLDWAMLAGEAAVALPDRELLKKGRANRAKGVGAAVSASSSNNANCLGNTNPIAGNGAPGAAGGAGGAGPTTTVTSALIVLVLPGTAGNGGAGGAGGAGGSTGPVNGVSGSCNQG